MVKVKNVGEVVDVYGVDIIRGGTRRANGCSERGKSVGFAGD